MDHSRAALRECSPSCWVEKKTVQKCLWYFVDFNKRNLLPELSASTTLRRRSREVFRKSLSRTRIRRINTGAIRRQTIWLKRVKLSFPTSARLCLHLDQDTRAQTEAQGRARTTQWSKQLDRSLRSLRQRWEAGTLSAL